MTIRKKSSAAAMLTHQIDASRRKSTDIVEEGLAHAVGRRLEERHIAAVPGLPEDQKAPEWYDIAIELHRRHEELLTEREARHEAEQRAAQTTPDLIRSTLAGAAQQQSSTMPLNGTRVLHAALAGGGGTINSTGP